jgi:hypothetical protein
MTTNRGTKGACCLLVASKALISMGGPMEDTAYLRRQALFYLRLSHLCLDPPLTAHLRIKAAEFHEKALRAEFEVELNSDVRGHAHSEERCQPLSQGATS